MTVLLIEDEGSVRDRLSELLETRGMTVTVAGTAAVARQALQRDSFLVVILDVTTGDGSWLDLLEELRRVGSTAHVIMTSSGSSESDRVRALERGADDYVVKPFHPAELAARVLAVKRRHDPRNDLLLRAGHLEIDIAARTVVASGKLVELTAKEFDLLAFLAARPGHVFSRDELLRTVWQSAPEWQKAATVTEHIHRLRVKLERDLEHPKLLRTVRRAGYRFDRPAETCDTHTIEVSPGNGPGSIVWTADGIVSADSLAAELLGWRGEQDLIGQHPIDLVAPRSVDAAVERLRLVGLGGTMRSQLLHLLRADGTEVSVELDSWASEWKGHAARSVTISLAPEPSVRLRHLVTGIATEVSDAVVVTDLHFHVRSWNRAAERLYGWVEHEVLGRHVLDVLTWPSGDGGLAEAWATLETTGRWHGEALQTTRDGAVIRVQGSTTVACDDDGEPIAVVSINRAVTLPGGDTQAPATTHDDLDMRRGIDAGEFEVYYQPLVNLDVDRVVAVEGLIRWNHPRDGLLSANGFIETAERNGMIVDLGSFVLDSACHQGAAWLRTGHDLDVGINLSAREIADPSFLDRFVANLESSGMDPHHLWFEVTESMLVEDVEQASALLHRLAAIGVRISIDDFGTGWASLTYLKQFPIHALKIDRSFVETIDHNLNDTAIARSILSLGRELGLHVVAEGVETAAQQQALVALGCSMVQGFLYGVPTPAAAVPLHRLTSGGSRLGGLPARPATTGSEAAARTLEALRSVRAGDQRDQAGDERDQAADHRDESADHRDKAADLRDEAGDHRDRAGDQRDNASVRRDEAAARRDQVADLRDAAAERRDKAGTLRDEVGDQRDEAGNRRDEAGAGRDEAASDRDQAAARRDLAAERLEAGLNQRSGAAAPPGLARREAAADRRESAEDRRAGASERMHAESDRDTAQADRGVGADERAQAEADREKAQADRGAGASERTQAEADRDTAQTDRGAGANERTHAEADRETAQTDRGAGASERTHAEADRVTAGSDRWRSARERGEGSDG